MGLGNLFSKKQEGNDLEDLKKKFSAVASQSKENPPNQETKMEEAKPPVQKPKEINVVEVQGDVEVPSKDDEFEKVILAQDSGKEEREEEISKKSISNYLTEIKENYEDAKLISLVIQQVKELIEIDNNLNSKIGDVEVQIKREVQEREKLGQKVDKNYKELMELAKNMDKFVALYELVTNQFNPFLEQEGKKAGIPAKLDPADIPNPVEVPEAIPGSLPSQELFKKLKSQSVPKVEENEGPIEAPKEEGQDTNVEKTDPEGKIKQTKVLPDHLHFQLKDGTKIDSLSTLLQWLKETDDRSLQEYVTHYKNDFAGWIYHTFHHQGLSKKLSSCTNREEMINSLSEYINTTH